MIAKDPYSVDLSHCIQEQHGIGQTIYYNICDGTTHAVPWGAGDWVGVIALSIIIALAGAMFLALAIMIVRDV